MKSIYAIIVLIVLIFIGLAYLVSAKKLREYAPIMCIIIPVFLLILLVIFSLIVWRQSSGVKFMQKSTDIC